MIGLSNKSIMVKYIAMESILFFNIDVTTLTFSQSYTAVNVS
jgi:hypothetical protein